MALHENWILYLPRPKPFVTSPSIFVTGTDLVTLAMGQFFPEPVMADLLARERLLMWLAITAAGKL